MYLMFPIGIMYYFGTNLDNRFAVPGFWPTAEQSHKIPFDRDEMKEEYARLTRRDRMFEELKKQKAELNMSAQEQRERQQQLQQQQQQQSES